MIIFFISLVRIARCMNGERQAEGILWFRMPDMIAYPVKIAVMILWFGIFIFESVGSAENNSMREVICRCFYI